MTSLLLALVLTQPVQATYCDGWKDGWRAGWCTDELVCYGAPAAPPCPPPEEAGWDGYQHGFVRAAQQAIRTKPKKQGYNPKGKKP